MSAPTIASTAGAPAPALTVGVDLGGTGTRVIAWRDGTVVGRSQARTAELGAAEVPDRVARLARLITGIVPEGESPAAVGIGASGPVDVAAGVVHNQDTLPWFSDFPLVSLLRGTLGVPIAIDNDAVTAAVGEHEAGAGRGCDRMLMVTLGTGIGTAMLLGGRPVRGLDGRHPEGGHLPIASDPRRCYCGLTGCWEQAASRAVLQQRLRSHLGDDHPGRETLRRGIAAADDPEVRGIFARYGTVVGRGLAALHALYGPRVTVIGGSAADCLPLFADAMNDTLTRSAEYQIPTEVRPAALGDDAGAVGAAILARRAVPAAA